MAGLEHRYLFIGGLHRSGTSLVARMVAALPGAGGITGAPVPENEGAYLQSGIPHDARAGRPMHFGTDPDQHMTEAHPLNRLETRLRMEADWAPWFPAGVRWRVEKSPVNLTRMRLLQQLFPMSQFVVVLRHPEAVAAAVAKWVDDPPEALLVHWLDAHEIAAGDIPHLHAVLVMRYEDLVADPNRARARLAAFLDTEPGPQGPPEPVRDGNLDYSGATRLDPHQSERAQAWGYGAGLHVDRGWTGIVRHQLNAIQRAVRDCK